MAEKQKPLVLIAVDGSDRAEKAVNYYVNYLHQPKNDVLLVHCMEMPFIPAPVVNPDAICHLLKERKDQSANITKKYADILKTNGIHNKVSISDFDFKPGQYISHLAKEKNVNMIVMGSRGQGTIRRTIMGSTSDYVVHHAHCPVLICKE